MTQVKAGAAQLSGPALELASDVFRANFNRTPYLIPHNLVGHSLFTLLPIRSNPTSAGTQVVLIADPSHLDRLRPAWEDLLRRSETDEPMLSPLWLLAWWHTYGRGTGRKLRVGLFYQGGRLVGLAPLVQRRYWYLPGIPFRRLEPLGTGEDGGDGVCSEYLNIIAERGAEGYVAGELARALAAGEFGSWDELVLPMMNGDGPLPTLLHEAFRSRGLAADCRQTSQAPYIPLPASWDAYLRLLPGSSRRYLQRSLRDFESWAGPGLEVRRATSALDLEEGRGVLMGLHGERWAAAGRPGGAFGVPHFRAFHDAVLPQLLAVGALELLWLIVHGRPVAALYNLVWGGKVYFYQSGRATDVPKHIRPGIALHAYAIRAAIEAGRREYDFLGDPVRYKLQLALASRPLVRFRAARRTLREQARLLADCGVAGTRFVRDRIHAVAKRGTSPGLVD
jgi:CelD/BcsL family acetyltransferase involved in cellulose biosynthesis